MLKPCGFTGLGCNEVTADRHSERRGWRCSSARPEQCYGWDSFSLWEHHTEAPQGTGGLVQRPGKTFFLPQYMNSTLISSLHWIINKIFQKVTSSNAWIVTWCFCLLFRRQGWTKKWRSAQRPYKQPRHRSQIYDAPCRVWRSSCSLNSAWWDTSGKSEV